MNIDKYKEKLEEGIYKGYDDKLYIHGKVVERVLREFLEDMRGNKQQNSYLHVLISYLAVTLGYSLNFTKHYLKTICPIYQRDENGVTYYISTADLNKDEKRELIEWIRNFAAMEIGLYLPTSEEYYTSPEIMEQFMKEINSNKEFL